MYLLCFKFVFHGPEPLFCDPAWLCLLHGSACLLHGPACLLHGSACLLHGSACFLNCLLCRSVLYGSTYLSVFLTV